MKMLNTTNALDMEKAGQGYTCCNPATPEAEIAQAEELEARLVSGMQTHRRPVDMKEC